MNNFQRFIVYGSQFLLLLMPGLLQAAEPFCQFEPLSESVYIINGSNSRTCPAKSLQHPVTNPVAIVGQSGVVLVDPGSSQQVGQLVLDRLRKITDQPVIAIINSHIHGLYWLANHAIKQAYPTVKIYAHKRMIERIGKGEGSFWVYTITRQVAGPKTYLQPPSHSLNGNETLNLNGIPLKIHHTPNAHTDHDILVEVIKDKILILGGLVVEPEVPSQGVPGDANFKGQIAATEYVLQLDMRSYVPGQGYAQGIELVKRGHGFLQAMYQLVEKYYDEGLADFEITEKIKIELAPYQQWYHFDALGRVISEIYLQVEQDSFNDS